MMGPILTLLDLTKAKLTAAVTLSVATGYLLFTERFETGMFHACLGVFLLACASCALNQVQEARYDRIMRRTLNRPIPSGRIDVDWALFWVLCLLGGGLYALSLVPAHVLTVLALGGGCFLWYNGVYTYLKRITAFAVVPGALVGAAPPIIGWTAGGGIAWDPSILEVGFFFFLWQIPHFWLLLLLWGEDYAAAGLPTLTRLFSKAQLTRITSAWILAVAATGAFLSFRLGPVFRTAVLALTIWLVLRALAFLRAGEKTRYFRAFMEINGYTLGMMMLLSADALWD